MKIREVAEFIGALILLVLLSPVWLVMLISHWIKLKKPRGTCLTYQMTEEQLEYFHAELAREREEEARKAQSPG